jgi:para-aminobenzoate synthetase component 1
MKNKMNNYGKEGIPFLFILDFALNKPRLIPFEKLEDENILFNIQGVTNIKTDYIPAGIFRLTPEVIDFKTYNKAYNMVQAEIKAGNTYLLNLSFETRLKEDISLFDIFLNSKAKYKLLYKNKFVVFSPESFVTIRDGKISAFPMKGTIDAGRKDALKIIKSDLKESAEHATIVDLLRNDLSRVSHEVKVKKYRYIDEIKSGNKHLLQVSSEITAQLAPDYKNYIGDIMYSLLPAGSVSGAPKKKTVEIISKIENYDRGYYTGVFGHYDGKGNLDSGVMIRFIERKKDGLYYKSGGGITFMSSAPSEYQELIDKIYVPIY